MEDWNNGRLGGNLVSFMLNWLIFCIELYFQ